MEYAFPINEHKSEFTKDGELIRRSQAINHGMTLRDYFASKVAQGFLAGSTFLIGGKMDSQQIAQKSYLIADAMMEERKAK